MHRRGFSILEVLITIVVVGIALVPLLLSFKTSSRSVTGTRDHLVAVAFAQLALEELRNTAFRKPTAAATAGAVVTLDDKVRDLNTRDKTLEENGVAFERTVTLFPAKVENLPAGQPDLVVVQVLVRWKAAGAPLLAGSQEYQIWGTLGSATQP
jgi:prepilin-type N-terminal cleavage/methylation domain-containing protein